MEETFKIENLQKIRSEMIKEYKDTVIESLKLQTDVYRKFPCEDESLYEGQISTQTGEREGQGMLSYPNEDVYFGS